jgi:hypothetical protein
MAMLGLHVEAVRAQLQCGCSGQWGFDCGATSKLCLRCTTSMQAVSPLVPIGWRCLLQLGEEEDHGWSQNMLGVRWPCTSHRLMPLQGWGAGTSSCVCQGAGHRPRAAFCGLRLPPVRQVTPICCRPLTPPVPGLHAAASQRSLTGVPVAPGCAALSTPHGCPDLQNGSAWSRRRRWMPLE